MRRALNGFYDACGLAAGVFMVAIGVLSLINMGVRFFGLDAGSWDEFAGWAMAASSFLGLAYTFRRNEHIRVSLLLDRLPASTRQGFEWAALAVSLFLGGYFTWFSLDMVKVSWQIGDMSQGLIAVPLWIPQLGMAIGVLALFVAVLDDLLVAVSGGDPSYRVAEKTKTVSLTENV